MSNCMVSMVKNSSNYREKSERNRMKAVVVILSLSQASFEKKLCFRCRSTRFS